ncbi:MAG: AAA family ATPase [Calditrichaeota bacterium]|nr:AAA family ATPase [Calditrichota bacterium]
MVNQFLKRVQIKNILSFDEEGIDLEMQPLNVLIGPNAVGKSNFISALEIMFSLPWSFQKHLKKFEGDSNLLWKGIEEPLGKLQLTIEDNKYGLIHIFEFISNYNELILQREVINPREIIKPIEKNEETIKVYFEVNDFEGPFINTITSSNKEEIKRAMIELEPFEEFNPQESILSQRQDPRIYPELTYLRQHYLLNYNSGIFRNPNLINLRKPNEAKDENRYLWSDDSNLALVVSKLDSQGILQSKVIPKLKSLYDIIDIRTTVDEGNIKLDIFEKNIQKSLPLSRISDGTVRFLRLLAIIFNPNAPKVICLEEPENGLHPEVIPALADALIEASEDKQIIVTTHSADLVSEFSSTPEYVVVCEREDAGTQMKRLDVKDIDLWLERYRLGKLWEKGVIGGTRY